MALESQLKRLSDIVRAECLCAACHKEFDEPKCLPCTHNFCMKCLKKATRSRSKYVECPIDRHKFLIPAGGISALPTNISLMRILEATPKRQAVAELEEALNKSRWDCCRGHYTVLLRDTVTVTVMVVIMAMIMITIIYDYDLGYNHGYGCDYDYDYGNNNSYRYGYSYRHSHI